MLILLPYSNNNKSDKDGSMRDCEIRNFSLRITNMYFKLLSQSCVAAGKYILDPSPTQDSIDCS